MGFFKTSQEIADRQKTVRGTEGENIYNNGVKPYLSEKDGNKHIIMINSMLGLLDANAVCDEKTTIKIDTILSYMQNDGFEIVDVKFESIYKSDNKTAGFNIMIIYK